MRLPPLRGQTRSYDLMSRCPLNTYENEWNKCQASMAPVRPMGVQGEYYIERTRVYSKCQVVFEHLAKISHTGPIPTYHLKPF